MTNFSIIISVLLFISTSISNSKISAQDFEGEILYKKETVSDTLKTIYYLKGDYIRIDFYDNNGELEKYKIFNKKEKLLKTVSPKRKLYKLTSLSEKERNDSSDYKITKTENYKDIYNHKCYQWLVKNRAKNTIISYWVTNENEFFPYILQSAVSSAEKASNYFAYIPESNGYFPYLVVERSLLREKRTQVELLSISEKKLSSNLFKIPKGYKKFAD